MLKIFTTQLNGVFNTIAKDEFSIEDAARLLAQAVIGDGHIYIHGFQEMQGAAHQAMHGIEPMSHCKPLFVDGQLADITEVDRVLLFSRYNDDSEAVKLAEEFSNMNVPFVAISTITDPDIKGIQHFADIHINLQLKRGLVPTDTGKRIGFPSLLVALYTFEIINLTLKEVLEDLSSDL